MIRSKVDAKTGKLIITTPVGRVINKAAYELEPQWTDKKKTVPKLYKPGTKKAGQQIMSQNIGLAIAKNNPDWPMFWDTVHNYVLGIFGKEVVEFQDFAYKIKDGDTVGGLSILHPNGPVKPGKQLNPETAGCYVIWAGQPYGALCPVYARCTDPTKLAAGAVWSTAEEEGIDPQVGGYVQLNLEILGNGTKDYDSDDTPGIYINPRGILHVGHGKPIAFTQGEDPNDMFTPLDDVYIPDGVSNTPVALVQQDPAMVTAPGTEAIPPARQSKEEFTAGIPSSPASPPAPDVPLYQLGPNANGYATVEALVAAFKAHNPAWTEAELVKQGYLV